MAAVLWAAFVVAALWLLALSAGVAWLSMPAKARRPRPVPPIEPLGDAAWRARQLEALHLRFRQESAKPDILRDEQKINDLLDWRLVLDPPSAEVELRPSVPVIPGRAS